MLYQHIKHPHKPRNINKVHAQEQQAGGFNTKLAVAITKAFGSIQAFYVLVGWMLVWIALASGGVWLFASDKYPFSFLLFLSNLVQLWALPVLAVGQAVLGRKAELMAEEQYNTTEKSYHDLEQVMLHLDKQDEKILEIDQRILELLQALEANNKPAKQEVKRHV